MKAFELQVTRSYIKHNYFALSKRTVYTIFDSLAVTNLFDRPGGRWPVRRLGTSGKAAPAGCSLHRTRMRPDMRVDFLAFFIRSNSRLGSDFFLPTLASRLRFSI